jgi:hypothetical protein
VDKQKNYTIYWLDQHQNMAVRHGHGVTSGKRKQEKKEKEKGN